MSDIPLINTDKPLEPYSGTVLVKSDGSLFYESREKFIEVIENECMGVLDEIIGYFVAEYDRRVVKRNTLEKENNEVP